MKKFLFLIIILLQFQSRCLSQDKGKILSDYLRKEMNEQKIPGLQVTVIKYNEIIFSESLGYANIPFSVNTNEKTIFSINSIAKVFAATAIMQLVEENKMDIADPISKHLEGLPKDWGEITIKQLLSHTSGLPDIEDPISGDLVGGKGQEFAWISLQKMPLQFKAGEEFNYNATNYLLVQRLIEKYCECPFEKFIEKRQFEIAEMSGATFGNSFDVVENKSPTYSYYYFDKAVGDYVLGNKLLEVSEEFPTMLRADAGAFSSAQELAKWVIALQTGKFLKDNRSLKKMWQPVELNNGGFGEFGGILNAYGLGWPVVKREKHPAVLPIGGGRAAFGIYPEDDLAVILLVNLSGVMTHDLVDKISKIYLSE
ncbi:serine hydrolase domain-containing protein [Maribacter sp. 4G9]|uniref:serine hydrolase domain-containing protein n=1 Tax=Maribacter sp. 4G9 TaxID=1889777 RepID=UPI000C14BBFB|nr:serine hydrolase domain-containing protein [Maribacter sp. 4G9]PIB32665.1 serine hydrolase [Maribacter sp. 4G9]